MDESNDDTMFTRNFLRHEILPQLAVRFPHYRESLARAARHAADAGALTEALAKIDLGEIDGGTPARAGVDATLLDKLPRARQCNALYWWLRWCQVTPPSSAQLDEWARVIFRTSPTDRPHQAGGHDFLIVRRRDRLTLQLRD